MLKVNFHLIPHTYYMTWQSYTIRSKKKNNNKQTNKKTQHFQNRFSHIYTYQNTPYYVSNEKQLAELHDGENCM